jgi:hypothetical protein
MEAMAKYIWSVAVLFAVLGLAFTGSPRLLAAVTSHAERTDAPPTPEWKTERLAADPQTADLPAGALSPIYPATPGKELLDKPAPPVRVLRAHVLRAHVQTAKRKPAENLVRQAVRTDRLPRQIYAARTDDDAQDDDDAQQAYAYAPEREPLPPRAQPPRLINLAHGIY